MEAISNTVYVLGWWCSWVELQSWSAILGGPQLYMSYLAQKSGCTQYSIVGGIAFWQTFATKDRFLVTFVPNNIFKWIVSIPCSWIACKSSKANLTLAIFSNLWLFRSLRGLCCIKRLKISTVLSPQGRFKHLIKLQYQTSTMLMINWKLLLRTDQTYIFRASGMFSDLILNSNPSCKLCLKMTLVMPWRTIKNCWQLYIKL